MDRKLAAILAADVAGYSRLMGADEEGTLNALRAHREVVDGLIAARRGRVFNSAGDSVIAEFASAMRPLFRPCAEQFWTRPSLWAVRPAWRPAANPPAA